MPNCGICETPLKGVNTFGTGPIFDCPRCGRWQPIPPPSEFHGPETLTEILGSSTNRRSRASHIVRRQQRDDGGHVGVPIADLQRWGLDEPLPAPPEQLADLILWFGNHQGPAASAIEVELPKLAATIGVLISPENPEANLHWLIEQATRSGLLEHRPSNPPNPHIRLKFAGWEQYGKLRVERPESRSAFMAMKFNDPDLDDAFHRCFRPAVEAAGFELRRLSDGQPAGLIDDQLRVALRTCRIVIADLTHGNLGAYWEAGFAEGLGRHVIYTCRKSEWDEQKPHFDTNHLVTIIWEADKLDDASNRLTATIRATLPAEARMGS